MLSVTPRVRLTASALGRAPSTGGASGALVDRADASPVAPVSRWALLAGLGTYGTYHLKYLKLTRKRAPDLNVAMPGIARFLMEPQERWRPLGYSTSPQGSGCSSLCCFAPARHSMCQRRLDSRRKSGNVRNNIWAIVTHNEPHQGHPRSMSGYSINAVSKMFRLFQDLVHAWVRVLLFNPNSLTCWRFDFPDSQGSQGSSFTKFCSFRAPGALGANHARTPFHLASRVRQRWRPNSTVVFEVFLWSNVEC